MPHKLEAKCFEFTVQILPIHLGAPRGGGGKTNLVSPPRFVSVYALVQNLIAG